MPARLCLEPGCPQLVRDGNVRCPEHRRPGTAARGYGARWQALSAEAREIQPWCSDCGAEEDLTADHLRWPATALADVEVVCRACNSRRGAMRRILS